MKEYCSVYLTCPSSILHTNSYYIYNIHTVSQLCVSFCILGHQWTCFFVCILIFLSTLNLNLIDHAVMSEQ